MDRRARWTLLVALLVVAPLARAAEDQHEYLVTNGRFVAGFVATSVEGVSEASFLIAPIEGFHHLRLALDYDPATLAASTPVADATMRYRMEVEVLDAATNASLVTYEYRAPGHFTFVADDESPLRFVVRLTHGADVAWSLRVNALPDPRPVE